MSSAGTQCSSCRGEVSAKGAYLSTDGEPLCTRCYSHDAAIDQVHRAGASIREQGGGGIGGLVALATASAFEQRSQAELAVITASGPATGPSSACQSCRTPADPSALTYAPNGALLCKGCTATFTTVMAEQRRKGKAVPMVIALCVFGLAMVAFMVMSAAR